MREVSLVSFLLNPDIYAEVSGYLTEDLLQNSNSKVLLKLVQDGLTVESLGTVKNIIKHEVQKPEELISIIERVPVSVSDEEKLVIISKLETYIRERLLAKALKIAVEQGADAAIDHLSTVANFNLGGFFNRILDFTNPELLKSIQESGLPTAILKSKYETVNSSLLFGGYCKKQLVMVAAAPGVGKSTLMINEGANFISNNWKVLHIFLGDLVELDILVRYLSVLTQTISSSIVGDMESYIKTPPEEFNNLRTLVYPSGELSAKELYNECKSYHKKFPFDVVIIDYDGNLKNVGTNSDNLYLSGGDTYSYLDRLDKDMDCLVLVGSQTKPFYWQHESVPKEAPAESSKKQHVVDLILGLGRSEESGLLGTITLSKSRRGGEGVAYRVLLSYASSSIEEISEDRYKKIVENQKTLHLSK